MTNTSNGITFTNTNGPYPSLPEGISEEDLQNQLGVRDWVRLKLILWKRRDKWCAVLTPSTTKKSRVIRLSVRREDGDDLTVSDIKDLFEIGKLDYCLGYSMPGPSQFEAYF